MKMKTAREIKMDLLNGSDTFDVHNLSDLDFKGFVEYLQTLEISFCTAYDCCSGHNHIYIDTESQDGLMIIEFKDNQVMNMYKLTMSDTAAKYATYLMAISCVTGQFTQIAYYQGNNTFTKY
jgi:hypothetical protein